jgi:hypothetical protein
MLNSNTALRTPMSLQKAGLDALVEALGTVDAIRFIRLFDNGHGDYTSERHEYLDSLSVDDVLKDMGVV